jgi:CemA family
MAKPRKTKSSRPPKKRLRRMPTRRSVEPIGILPRSIFRTLGRFVRQLFQTNNTTVIEEFRISRYQILVSLRTLLLMIFVPMIAHDLSRHYVLTPMAEHLWNGQQQDLFLNHYFEHEALHDLEGFEAETYFDMTLRPSAYAPPFWASYLPEDNTMVVPERIACLQRKTVDLARDYNQRSITALINLTGDMVTSVTLILVMINSRAELIIFKSFLIEFIYSMSDTVKSVGLILGTNLLVGFHSPRGWELFLELTLDRYGFPPEQNFVFLFVASFPVLLDTVFKYWIFRYLNKISPSTVATYHAMIE